MTEAQIQLQNALTTTFLANLVFLSEYDKDLYHRVDELSKMIENGTYEEKYHLEFIMEDGDFDIYDVVNNKYLYLIYYLYMMKRQLYYLPLWLYLHNMSLFYNMVLIYM